MSGDMKDKEIVSLRKQGLSFSQIAAITGLTKDQAQKRYKRILYASTMDKSHHKMYLDRIALGDYNQEILPTEVLPQEVDDSNSKKYYPSLGSIERHQFRPVDPLKVEYLSRVGRPSSNTRGEIVVCAGDFQFPFEDGNVFTSFLTFLATETPERIVLTGDIVDLTSVSAYDKDPRLGMPVQHELQHAYDRLAEIRAAAGPDADIYFLYGNHEARMSKWLAKKAPELVGLTDANGVEMLSLENLLRLDSLGIKPVIDQKPVFSGPEHLRSYYKITEDLIATHGTYSRNTGGGASIAPIADAAGVSVVGGHDHSQGVGFRTIGGFADIPEKRIAAISTGMMCQRTELGYLAQHQVSRWAAGFAVIELWGAGAGEWQPDFASWTGSELVWRGRRYPGK
jgi:hypothetical protein